MSEHPGEEQTGAAPVEPLVDDLLDETRRPGEDRPHADDREEVDPPSSAETPEPPD